MLEPLMISRVRFTAADPDEIRTGLLGWVSCVLDGALLLDGIAVRRTLGGEITLSFPARRNQHGGQFFYYRPISDRARRQLEAAILGSLPAVQEAQS